MSKTKSYKGNLGDGLKERIRLKTNNGLTGYRITKFQVIPEQPFNKTQESIIKIYKVPVDGNPDGVVDFTDARLLAVGIFKQHDTSTELAYETVVFDNEVFNQDIHLTSYDAATGESLNYYLELEQIKLDTSEATMATLQNMKSLVDL